MVQSLASRLGEAARLKDEGNAKFKAGDYKGAVVAYKRVFLFTRGLDTSAEGDTLHQYGKALHRELPTGDQVAVARQISGAVSGNLAAAYLHLGDWERVIQFGKKVRPLRVDGRASVPAGCPCVTVACVFRGAWSDRLPAVQRSGGVTGVWQGVGVAVVATNSSFGCGGLAANVPGPGGHSRQRQGASPLGSSLP